MEDIRKGPDRFRRRVLAHPLGEENGFVFVHFAIGQDAGADADKLVNGFRAIVRPMEEADGLAMGIAGGKLTRHTFVSS
ncbi:hypothetical protein GCM10028824_42570 [Hymenobacter segetis]